MMILNDDDDDVNLESRRGVGVRGWVVWGGVGAKREGAREAVDGGISTLDTRLSTLDARRSNLESRISAPDGRGFDSIRFVRFVRFVRSFVRLAVTLARSVETMSRERGDGGTTGANDDDDSMDECLERLSRERLERTTFSLFLQRSRPTDRRPTIE